ncbi:MAG: type IV toxin-antitoxin system AbiEi family antitoxin [Candidatus Micrarchaeota archaeon]
MVEAKNMFEGKASRVVRVLLVKWPKTWDLRNLAKEAQVSLGTAQAVVNTLLKENYAIRESKRGEFKLMNPWTLLKRWAAYNTYNRRHKFVHYYTSEQEIEKFLEKMKSKKGPPYALTTLVGALQVAPYVRPTNIHLYVQSEQDARKWAELLELQPTEQAGNIIFAIPDDSSIFYGVRDIGGIKVVSNIQLYVDLLNYPARGEEAAEQLYKKIEKEWAGKG